MNQNIGHGSSLPTVLFMNTLPRETKYWIREENFVGNDGNQSQYSLNYTTGIGEQSRKLAIK